MRIYGGTVEFHTWFGGISSGAGGKLYSTLSDLNQNMLSEPFRIGIQSANPIIMKTTPNTNEYLSMKATILFGFMFFFLPSSLMKNNITRKAKAIAPKVIALFIQMFSGFTIYSPSICKPTSQPTAISVTPTDNPIIKFRNIKNAISSLNLFHGDSIPNHTVRIRINPPII